MKSIYVIIIFFFLLLNSRESVEASSKDSLRMDIFLNKSMLKTALIDFKFINSIDYSPTGFILLASSTQFHMLGLGGIRPVFEKITANIDSYTVTQDDILLVLCGNKLCYIDSLGFLSILYDLPVFNAGIISGNGNNVAYIYDKTFQKDKKEYVIYSIKAEEQYTRLLSISFPILSAFEYKTSLLFSSENKILCADSRTKTFFDFFSLPSKQDIISIAGDTINHAIYFSTSDTIYRIKNNRCEYICGEFGGILKYDGEGLLVFNSRNNLIIRFRNSLLYSNIIDNRRNQRENSKNIEYTEMMTVNGEKIILETGDYFEGDTENKKIKQGKLFDKRGNIKRIFWDMR